MRFVGLAIPAALALLAPAATAQSPEAVAIELNKTEQQGEDCQVYLMMENGAGRRFDSLALDLVMIDRDGIIARRLAVDVAPLRPGRTTVKVFAVEDMQCEGIERVLLNDILACRAEDGASDDCLELVQTSARGPIAFD